MRAKEFLGELVPLAPAAAAAAPAIGAAARSAIPRAIQFGKELYKKVATPATKPSSTTPAASTAPSSSIIQVPQKVGGGARDAATQSRMQSARQAQDGRGVDRRYPDIETPKPPSLVTPTTAGIAGTAAAAVPLFTMGGDKGKKDNQAQTGGETRGPAQSTPAAPAASTPAAPAASTPAAPAASTPAAPAASTPAASTSSSSRPAQAKGVVGQELAQASGGQFATKADRLNQEKVDAVLGAGKYKAGSAAANIALRDYYKQQNRPSDTAADDALRAQFRQDELNRQRKEREGASSSTVVTPSATSQADQPAAPAAQSTSVAPSVALTPAKVSSQARKSPEQEPAGADSGGDSAGWETPPAKQTPKPIDPGVDTSWGLEEELKRIIKLSKR